MSRAKSKYVFYCCSCCTGKDGGSGVLLKGTMIGSILLEVKVAHCLPTQWFTPANPSI